MPPFGFRLRFFAYGPRLQTDETSLTFELSDGHTVRLAAARGNDVPLRLVEEGDFQIRGTGFPTSEDARRCGERLRRAIRRSSVELRTGFDVGRDVATGRSSDDVKKAGLERG